MIAASASPCVVPARGRELAARLAVLFDRDVEIVRRLNDAHRRLRCANERMWSGLSPDALGLIYDGTASPGRIQVAGLGDDARLASGLDGQTEMLRALQEIHGAIHRGLCEYQSASEERRQLAFDVGELAGQLTEALCAAGWSADQARKANVHELAGGSHETGRGGSLCLSSNH
jgi:hypothetical protein